MSTAFREGLRGARAVVVGLGASGVAAARLLLRAGAKVTANDALPRERLSADALSLEADGAALALGGHDGAGIEAAQLVVVSPGVPRFDALDEAARRGAEVIGELELATRLLPHVPSIAITGSNGKSTTTTLVGELLGAAGKRPFVGGNLGSPPSDLALTGDRCPFDVLVLEVSSYQAERMPRFRPKSAALLNASPNHLDRYDGYDDYVKAKGNLFVNQRSDDIAVIPANDATIEQQARRGQAVIVRFGVPTDADARFVRSPTEIADRATGATWRRDEIRVRGEHNAMNVCAALALVSPFGVHPDVARAVLAEFRGLPHRIAFIRTIDGVSYYDDSKGTNVGASVAAIRGLSEARVVLIAGGRDKLGAYDPLVDALRERGRGAVLIGEAADRIQSAIGDACPTTRASSMEEAVHRARELAQSGDAVLLSPACSSFDMFRDYKHRGDAFVEVVNALVV
ncbi:MAG: UDP-N-acetylmuramoyl-L-alanine--D-glutamate ligase [Polyangiaceae bacterium]